WDDILGGDIPLDTLFPADGSGYPTGDTNPPAATSPAPAAAPQAPATQAQPPAAPADGQPATYAGTYKTREEAERGLAEKDRIIEQYRTDTIKRTGIDPLTGRPVTPQQPNESYVQNPERYWDDLAAAAQKGDKISYVRAQAKFISEVLSPVAPLIQNTAKQQALDALSLQIKTPEGQPSEIRSFIGSPDYQAVLTENPLLKNAIENAETNFQLYAQLPDLYRMAYGLSQYRKQPELLKAATVATATAAANPTPPARPTATPSTLPAPIPTSQVSGPDIHTAEGRKEMIKRFEQQGIQDFKF